MKNKTLGYIIMGILITLLSLPLLISPSLAEKLKSSEAIFYVW